MPQAQKKVNNSKLGKLDLMEESARNNVSKDASKKLSFFPDIEGSDGDSDSLPAISLKELNGKLSPEIKMNSEGRTVRPAGRAHGHNSTKEIDSDDHDDSSTGSCSCEDHSSVGDKSDDDNPHGDLDYDEGSITDSPSNGNQRSASLDDTTAPPNCSSLENSDHQHSIDSDQTKSHRKTKLSTQDEHSDLLELGSEENATENRTKLKSFIVLNQGQDEDDPLNETKPSKNRSHKSYHGLLKYFFKDSCYFQIKSINHENVDISKSMGVWSTPLQNEARLNAAFREHSNVILIFSVQQSGAFQGFARMTSEARPYTKPVPWVLPERLNRANLGGVFKVEWLCTKALTFGDTHELRNPLNNNKPIKVARDGQQVDSSIGKKLCMLFPRDSKKRLLASIDTLKLQTRQRKQNMHQRGSRGDPRDHKSNQIGQAIIPPQAYPPLMNGYAVGGAPATSQPDDHYGHGQYHYKPTYPAYEGSRGRVGGRRRGVVEQSRVAAPAPGAFNRYPSHFMDPTEGPSNYNTGAYGTNPAPNYHSQFALHQGLDPTILERPHANLYANHYPLQPSYHMAAPYHDYPQHSYIDQWANSGTSANFNQGRYHPYQRGKIRR